MLDSNAATLDQEIWWSVHKMEDPLIDTILRLECQSHFFQDLVPYLDCCLLSDNCERYFEKRPSDDGSRYVPPRPGNKPIVQKELDLWDYFWLGMLASNWSWNFSSHEMYSFSARVTGIAQSIPSSVSVNSMSISFSLVKIYLSSTLHN